MSNTLKVIDMVAKEALRIAHEKATFVSTINRSYDDSFAKTGAKIGSTLRVRDPNQYTRRQGSRVMDVQDQDESTQTITVATQATGSVLFHDWMYSGRMFFIDKLVKAKGLGPNSVFTEICDVFAIDPDSITT